MHKAPCRKYDANQLPMVRREPRPSRSRWLSPLPPRSRVVTLLSTKEKPFPPTISSVLRVLLRVSVPPRQVASLIFPALPESVIAARYAESYEQAQFRQSRHLAGRFPPCTPCRGWRCGKHRLGHPRVPEARLQSAQALPRPRSEERRVGKECRSRWS